MRSQFAVLLLCKRRTTSCRQTRTTFKRFGRVGDSVQATDRHATRATVYATTV